MADAVKEMAKLHINAGIHFSELFVTFFLWLNYIENANDDVYVPYCEESLALYPEAIHTLMHQLTLLMLDAFIVRMC